MKEARARAPQRPLLPRFHTTAADHVERSDPRARQRVNVRNSFTPSQPVVDQRMFAGRRDLLATIIRAVEDQRSHVVIFGDRGVGKTSLLNMLAKAAVEARYIVVYFSCGATSDFEETFRAVATEIPLLYHSAVSPISSSAEAGSTLADLLGTEKLTPRMLGDAAAKLVGTRVLVLLDEFDRAESPEFRRDVAELIKTLSDVSARLQLVIAGVASDLVDLVEHMPSIRRSMTAVRVSAMSDEEVLALIENGSQMSGVDFEPQAKELVALAAGGSPYLTNLVCHVSGMIALDAGRSVVETGDVAQALDQAIDELCGRLPSELLRYLDQAASAPEPPPGSTLSGEIETREGGKSLRRVKGLSDRENISAKILDELERQGDTQRAKPAAYALMVDSLTPYLQLKRAREKFLQDAAPAVARGGR